MTGQRIACPDCNKTLQIRSGITAGTKMRCPACQVVFPVPAAEPEEAFEEAPARANGRGTAAAPNRRREHDDDDDAPRRPRKKKKKQGSNLGLILGLSIGGGVLVLGVVAFVIVGFATNWFSGSGGSKSKTGGDGQAAKDDRRPEGGNLGGQQPTGMVARIPATFHKDFRPEPLAAVETKLGGRGKMVTLDQLEPAMRQHVQTSLNVAPGDVLYYWYDDQLDLFVRFRDGLSMSVMSRTRVPAINPVGGDKTVREDPASVTGKVAVIPRNFIDSLRNKTNPPATTLMEVEAKLGGKGKLMTPGQLPPLTAKLGQFAPGATCYMWSSGNTRLYLFFHGTEFSGAGEQSLGK
jgi:hypothetical protein